MPSEENFEKEVEGAVAIDQEIPETADAASAADSNSRLETIRQMISDPAVPAADISRLIVLEMGTIIGRMEQKNVLERGDDTQRNLYGQVRALGVLHNIVFASRAKSNEDELNLDGKKFKFLLARFFDLCRKALEATGVDKATSSRMMLEFDVLWKAEDATLRSHLKEMGTGDSSRTET